MRDLQGGDTHALLALFSGLSATQRQKSLHPVETHNQSVITGSLGMHVAQRSRCVTSVQRSWAPAEPCEGFGLGQTSPCAGSALSQHPQHLSGSLSGVLHLVLPQACPNYRGPQSKEFSRPEYCSG